MRMSEDLQDKAVILPGLEGAYRNDVPVWGVLDSLAILSCVAMKLGIT